MKPEQLLRAILPSVIIDNFDIDKFEKTDVRFDIWLDEKKVQMREDKKSGSADMAAVVVASCPSMVVHFDNLIGAISAF